jgi:hypothetical protein
VVCIFRGVYSMILRKPQVPTKTYLLDKDNTHYVAHVRLWLAGFKAQHIISTEQIVAAVDKIPDRHLAGLRGIVYDHERVTQELMPYAQLASFSIKGAFFQQERCVVVYDFNSQARFEQVLYHEIGHYVFYCVLDSYCKQRWVTQQYPNSKFVSPIAARNASEDFAESYAYYLNKPATLRDIPSKYTFMNNEIFS